MPPAESFPALFDQGGAYVFGERRKQGGGVAPQCAFAFAFAFALALEVSFHFDLHTLPPLLEDPNDFLFLLGREHASAAAAVLQQVMCLLLLLLSCYSRLR